jgi:hypothetical protein
MPSSQFAIRNSLLAAPEGRALRGLQRLGDPVRKRERIRHGKQVLIVLQRRIRSWVRRPAAARH